MIQNLNQLTPGERGTIVSVETDPVTKERLESLGLIRGVEVDVVRSSPFGSPRIYKVLNTLIALRNQIASRVRVEVSHESTKSS